MASKEHPRKRQLFDDMTGIGFILNGLAQLIQASSAQSLTLEIFEKAKADLEEAADVKATPVDRCLAVPFLHLFLGEMEGSFSRKDNGESMPRFARILRNEEMFSMELTGELGGQNQMAPKWYSQVLQIGEELFSAKANLQENREKVGALLRNIPADTVRGFIAQSFLNALMQQPSKQKEAHRWWSYLKGESFTYRLHVRGLYAWLEF